MTDVHTHHHHHGGPGHSHGLIDPSIKRSRQGLAAIGWALLVLALTALAQTAVFVLSGSVALLADLIHNFGDAATAFPLAIAFALPPAEPKARCRARDRETLRSRSDSAQQLVPWRCDGKVDAVAAPRRMSVSCATLSAPRYARRRIDAPESSSTPISGSRPGASARRRCGHLRERPAHARCGRRQDRPRRDRITPAHARRNGGAASRA
jgi:hypothetical protein